MLHSGATTAASPFPATCHRRRCAPAPPRPLRLSEIRAVVRHVRICLWADRQGAGVHAAARLADHRRGAARRLAGALHRREHGTRDGGRLRLGGRRLRQRHAHPARADAGHLPPRACAGQDGRARRPVRVRLSGLLSRLRLPASRRTRRRDGGADRDADGQLHAAVPADPFQDGRAAPAWRVPDARLRTRQDRSLFSRHHPVFQRLPLYVRVLRHPRPLRPRAAAEDAGADHRGTRQAVGTGARRLNLFRRRQPRRQPPRAEGSAAPSRRLAEGERLCVQLRLRSDAQHRALSRHPRDDARCGLREHLLRYRNARARSADRHRQGAEQPAADPRRRPHHQRARDAGRLRHHPRPRYRHAGNRPQAHRLHRTLEDPRC